MKRILLFVLLTAFAAAAGYAQVRLAAKYSYPTLPGTPQDSVLWGLSSIRGCTFASDVDGDGKSEIAVTNYQGNGRVHIFEAVANDSIRLVWTSPAVLPGGSSTPRYVLFGDLDNDGKKEIIYQLNSVGIVIFEWDGVTGSDNYGTIPSQVIGSSFISGVAGNCEYMEVGDVDGDNQQELLVAYNGSTNDNDKYYIISGVGDWSTNDPGFSSFTTEYAGSRTLIPAKYALGGGSPMAMIAANFDGTGNKEILLHNWNLKNVVPMRVPSADTYLLSDTTTNKQNVRLGNPNDDVSLFGGMAYDVDGDGREEVYLPTYPTPAGGPGAGKVHMISYSPGQSTSIIDSANNVTVLDLSSITGTKDLFGYGWGDMNRNGKRDLYFSTSYSTNVVALEFQGGDKKNPANWIPRVVYRGDSTILTAINYRDSVGRRDTVRFVDGSFVSKMYGRNTDFDRDLREDIILPYQALSDSVTIRRLTWNVTGSRWDTVSATKAVNPKRWGLRIIEFDPTQGVEEKDLTIITPDQYRLDQNYPNPFNPTTTISFHLPMRDRISLTVYDILGREVRTLINNEEYRPGTSSVVWNGKDNSGKSVASGTYFYTLKFGNFEKTNKLMVLK